LNAADKHGRTAHALARLHPVVAGMVDVLQQGADSTQKASSASATSLSRHLMRHSRRRVHETEEGDAPGTRGGWAFPPELQDSNNVEAITEIHGNSDIDVVIGNSLSKGVFKRDYFSAQKPVLLTGEIFGNQPIWSYWRKEDLLHRYGALKLAVILPQDTLQSARAERSAGTLSAFIHDMDAQGLDARQQACAAGGVCSATDVLATNNGKVGFTNVASVQQPLMWSDVIPPPIFQLCHSSGAGVSAARSAANRHKQYPMRLVIAPKGTSFPMHTRAASWDLLLTGQKRWYLLPPMPLPRESSKNKVENQMSDPHAGIRERAEALDKLRVYPEKFHQEAAKMREEGLLFEVTQLPGEVLFIPHDWEQISISHAAADSISISQEVCALAHTDMRFLPLSLAIYGGKDDHRDQAGHPPTGYPDFFGMMSAMKIGAREELPDFMPNFRV
jgi:hypothetical protein